MVTVVKRGQDGRNVGHDLSGFRTGTLTVLQRTGEQDAFGYRIWSAKCDCGNVIEKASYRFIRGMKSCGCGPVGRPRIPDQGAHVNSIFGHYRVSANARGLVFALSKAEFRELIQRACHYCGIAPQERPTHKNLSGTFTWNRVDRVDSSIGYVTDNCVPCCPRCYWAKSDLPVSEFKEWVFRVYRHLSV